LFTVEKLGETQKQVLHHAADYVSLKFIGLAGFPVLVGHSHEGTFNVEDVAQA
jgi:hypothetical protein